MAQRLRARPGATGLVTSISGMITKSGAAVWSTEPPTRSFAARDVTRAALADTATRPLDPAALGAATIVGTTVVHDRGEPSRAVTVVETGDGTRTVARSSDPDTVGAMGAGDWIGRRVVVTGPGTFELSASSSSPLD